MFSIFLSNMNVSNLTWDSCFFGYPVGKINLSITNKSKLERTLCESRTNGYRLIYVFIPYLESLGEDVLIKYNGLLVDRKTNYLFEMENINFDAPILEEYVGSGDELYSLAYDSGIYSRFFFDKNFGEESFHLLYREWVDNSLNGKIADKVFIYRKDEEIAGFVTLKINENKATIGLIAVCAKFRGLLIGSQLINGCKKFAFDNHAEQLFVTTQLDNNAACSFYEKNGFSKTGIVNIYHFWL